MTTRHPFWLPTLARHLVSSFGKTFGLALTAFVAIYVLAELFDRFDTFLRNDVGIGTIAWAFALKVPLIVTQVMPIAVLAGSLVGLGVLARSNEFIAARACGVGLLQVATPLVAVAIALAALMFAWNETVVPATAREWHRVWNRDVRRRTPGEAFRGREVWYRGAAGFYNIERVAPRRQMLYGVTVYQLDDAFRPHRIIEADEARWTGAGWDLVRPRVREFGPEGIRESPGTFTLTLPETLEDFRVAAVEPEEFSFAVLRRQIATLRSRGIDVSEALVDLHLKLALPMASVLMMIIGVPLAARGTRATSASAATAFGFALGFGYFVVLAFARALGQSGSLPPVVAAWLANALFAVVGGYLALGTD